MLDQQKHAMTMRNILDEIYSHKVLSSLLGFKGGTACYFFYSLPRFSTDLDFNLLDLDAKEEVFALLGELLSKYGEIKTKIIKHNTILFFISHTPQRSGIKVEISTREIEKVNSYQLREFYGTSILVMKKEDIFAGKLLALIGRPTPTSRDLFDVNYFFKQNWNFNEKLIEKVSGQSIKKYLSGLVLAIKKNFKSSTIHQGLGELLENQSQRDFVKNKLIDETVGLIELYLKTAVDL
ncbi:nucleotidyl transferase AbiEii/AbiGii toxin family protein [Patescibacteria group bacterium]|nr:nucleotidyl transferase AbiEii/AbiGii toxin family protein [Patescibacteria group bacterium]MBU1885124.1 nucleotidyl transferase AbiEii/AbiGii toxin family protein [Patescibacteria group bacterium]